VATDFSRVQSYYAQFNEWSRLDTPAGTLEYEILKPILLEYLPAGSKVLDLGSGPGRYAFLLAENGCLTRVADLSPELVREAKRRSDELTDSAKQNLIGFDVVNAIDLAVYDDNTFDAILLFGPLYHLTADEIGACLREVRRTLKDDGLLLGIYMPFELGIKGILERAFYAPDHVNADTLERLVETGHFRNEVQHGFQEGYFVRTADLVKMIEEHAMSVIDLRSIRGIGYGLEEKILGLRESDPQYYRRVIDLVGKTARRQSVIDTCGHALVIAKSR
jgi:SAM-dependent methyltransferase